MQNVSKKPSGWLVQLIENKEFRSYYMTAATTEHSPRRGVQVL